MHRVLDYYERPMSQALLVERFNQHFEPGEPVAVEVEEGHWRPDVIAKRAELLKASVAVVQLQHSGLYLLSRVRRLL